MLAQCLTRVLIQPVDHKEKLSACGMAALRRSGNQLEQSAMPGGGGCRTASRSAGQHGQLLCQRLKKRLAVRLPRQPADEERHNLHSGGWVQGKPGHQRRLARPRFALPPTIGRGSGAEGSEHTQLSVPFVQHLGGDINDLESVRG